MEYDYIEINPYNCLLYKSAHISIIPLAYAIYSQKIGYSISIGSVLCTSLIYWKNPKMGMRRNIDIAVVHAVLIYHSYSEIGTKYMYEHYFFIANIYLHFIKALVSRVKTLNSPLELVSC